MSDILIDYTNDYPMNDPLPVRRVVLRGRYRGKPKSEAKDAGNPSVGPAITMRELTPPVQSDAERGEGDSINARMHKLLRGQQ